MKRRASRRGKWVLAGFVLSSLLAVIGGWLWIVLVSGSGSVARSHEPSIQDVAPPRIELARPRVGSIRGGESVAFHLDVAADRYLELEVEQRGIDLVLRLFDPRGARLIEVDSPTGRSGVETAAVMTPVAGDYRCEVLALDDHDHVGRYELRVAAMREASAMDRIRAAAVTTFAEAEALRRAGDVATFEKAHQLYDQAFDLWLELDEQAAAAWTHLRRGGIDRRLGRLAAGRRAYRRAVELFAVAGDAENEARALNDLGVTCLAGGDVPAALDAFERALDRAARSSLPTISASIENNLGTIFADLGRPITALDHYDAALAVWRELDIPEEQAVTLNNIGELYSSLRQFDDAGDHFEEALALMRRLGDRRGEARTTSNLGLLHERRGELDLAGERYRTALEIFREARDRLGAARTLNNLGRIHRAGGDLGRAETAHLEALEIARKIEDRRTEALSLADLGRLAGVKGEAAAALDHLHAALALFTGWDDTERKSKTLFAIAVILRQEGRLGEAQAHLEQALDHVEAIRTDVASAELRASYFATKHELYEAYVDLLFERYQRSADAAYAALAFDANQRARTRSLLDDLSARSARSAAVDPALRAREKALQAQLDRLENERFGRQLKTESDDPELCCRKQRSLLAMLARVRAQMALESAERAEPLRLEQIQRRILDAETLLLNFELAPKRSFLWVVSTDSSSLFELPGEAEIEKLAARAYRLLTRSQERLGHHPVAEVTAELGRLLLAPAAHQLGRKRLVIAGEGILQSIPFATLQEPTILGDAQPLLLRHETLLVPSISALGTIRRASQLSRSSAGKLAILADPVFEARDPRVMERARPKATSLPPDAAQASAESEMPEDEGLARLPASRGEAERILRLVDPDKHLVALDFDASLELVRGGRLRAYDVLHFATHGLLHPSLPELSGLVLSLVDEGGRKRDGIWRVHEISSLDLDAELVVLSACQTALGRETAGEGIQGLARAFLYAGARRVLVSLWQVDDEATAQLMGRFYQEMLVGGRSPSAALRAAQLSLRRDRRWRSPYYWAGFVLQGEWQKPAGWPSGG